ncbi:MAG: hypothetical protein N2322_01735, partial [Terrimicrobiaceae bacterium]|nr:hypothetical protein [Terrimicrobiaceae bacterium]
MAAADRWSGRAGPAILAVVALAYYSLYFNHGLNLGGEGGTTAVVAMRLNEGMRPIADTFLGYNVLWFYPVAWLFRLTGPDYLALRAFFFVVCAVTALLGFLTVRRITGSGLLALLTGLSLVLIPGMMFRNYMGLLGVGNQLAFTLAFLAPPRRPGLRAALMACAGGVVGLTFLVRVEVGWLMLFIWLGLLVLTLFEPGARNWRINLAGLVGGLAAMALVHLPFAWDAARRGYAREFWSQYTAYFALVRWEIQQLGTQPASSSPASQAPAPPAQAAEAGVGAGGSGGEAGAVLEARRPRPRAPAPGPTTRRHRGPPRRPPGPRGKRIAGPVRPRPPEPAPR